MPLDCFSPSPCPVSMDQAAPPPPPPHGRSRQNLTTTPPLTSQSPQDWDTRHVIHRSLLTEIARKARLYEELGSDRPADLIASILGEIHTSREGSLDEEEKNEQYERLLHLKSDICSWIQHGTVGQSAATTAATTEPRWASAAAHMPPAIAERAAEFVRLLSALPNLACDSGGHLVVDGAPVPGSNVSDLLLLLLRSLPTPPAYASNPRAYWNSKALPGLDKLLSAYAASSLPASHIRNSHFASVVQSLRQRSPVPHSVPVTSTLLTWRENK